MKHCCVSSPTMVTRTSHIVACILKCVNQPRMRTLSVMDYIDFMHRKRWKIYQDTNRMKLVGKYVEMFQASCSLYHVPAIDSFHSSLQLYIFPLPFFLSIIISILIRIVFFQLKRTFGNVKCVIQVY